MNRKDLLFRIDRETLMPLVIFPNDWASTRDPYDTMPMLTNALGTLEAVYDDWVKEKTRPTRSRAEWQRCAYLAERAGVLPTNDDDDDDVKMSDRFYITKARDYRRGVYKKDRPNG